MKKILKIIITLILLYLLGIQIISYLIKNGYTNSESDIIIIETGIDVKIPATNWIVNKYISENPQYSKDVEEAYIYLNGESQNKDRFPKNINKNVGFQFIIDGIEKRKTFVNEVKRQSEKLGIEYELVMSSILGEQVRIATKGARGKLKDIIINGTPTLFRSYDVSVGIGGIKVSTAYQIKKDSIKYGYGDDLKNDVITEEKLTIDDSFNAKYATYLVKNILTRRKLAGYDISNKPGVVGTLYNMGNDEDKKPNANPKIGGSIITVGNKNYVYGGISMGIYWYLKIYK